MNCKNFKNLYSMPQLEFDDVCTTVQHETFNFDFSKYIYIANEQLSNMNETDDLKSIIKNHLACLNCREK